MKKLLYLTLITLCVGKVNSQVTTFSANVVKADTVKSTGMISAGAITATDTIRAKDHVVIEQNLELQKDVSLLGRFDIGNGFAFKTYPANTNHPAVFRFGNTSGVTPGSGFNPPIDPEDMPSCANAPIGSNPLYSFNGFLKSTSSISGSNGSVIFGHDGANGLVDVQGLSSNTNSGGLLINYNCHRNVAICTGVSPNPTENKVYIGDFLNARKHVEIGNPIYPTNDPTNTALDIYAVAGKGIKFTTYNNTMPLISVANSNFTISPFTVLGSGQTYIGTARPNIAASNPAANALLSVYGSILAKEVFVAISNTYWADFVFNKDYKLMPLNEVKNYIQKYKHLPNVSSATELEEKGLALADMQKTQMQKIEELYLYIIKLNEEVELLKKQNNQLLKGLKNNHK